MLICFAASELGSYQLPTKTESLPPSTIKKSEEKKKKRNQMKRKENTKKETHETLNDKGKRKFEVWTTSDIKDDYANGSGDLLLPISFYNAEGGNDFPEFKQDLVISNKLNSPRAVQGMFGTRVNITQPHRNVPVGAPASERPEAYKITIDSSEMVISQPTGLSSVFYKNSDGIRY